MGSGYVVHEYRWAVGLAFGHPDEVGFEMSDPAYDTQTFDRPQSFDVYCDDVDIVVDGHTAQEDDWWLFRCSQGATCEDCGWVNEHCCCYRIMADLHVGSLWLVDLIELDNQKVQAALAEALVRRRVRRRTARLRWAFLRRVVRARSVVVFWMGEAARKACAPGGRGREADAVAFKAEFV